MGRRPSSSSEVDLRVRELREAAGRELLGRIGNADQAVFQLLLLIGGRRAAQDLQPAIDLNRVAADGHWVLPSLPQKLG